MDDVAPKPAHAKPSRGDLLWVLVLILACGLPEVWASWLQIGSVSGFPKLGGMTTGWILPVTSEAYWGAALFAWLATPAGPRSKKFAMWSAVIVFALSLCGQESDHLMAFAGRSLPPVGVVMFVTALPLISIALIAVLIHLRQKDREEAAEADERSAVQAEMDALRAGLEALTVKLADAEAERDAAHRETAEALAKTEALTRKLEAARPRKRPRNAAPKKTPAGTRSKPADPPADTPATEVPQDVDAQAEALAILAAEPDISGAKLAERVGMSERWGQTFKKNLATKAAPRGQDPEE